jgi:DNA ligase (NAD+)
MLSLNKATSESEFLECNRRPRAVESAAGIHYTAELKFDGLAVEVVYEGGVVAKGSTEDGMVGEDVT